MLADPLSMPKPASPNENGYFEWHGAQHAWSDIKEALAFLLCSDVPRAQLLAAQYEDPFKPATWELCNFNGQLLLRTLEAALARVSVHIGVM